MRARGLGAMITTMLLCVPAGMARAGDRHAGYYYPEPDSREVYTARADTLPQANRAMRIGFVTGITNQTFNLAYPPQVAIFAKGTEAQKLIIVALVDGRIDTLYRARAVFANMTAAARVLPAFAEMGVQDYFTFFDLAKMLGFEQITISNGRDFAHQVIIK
ncbi:MAG: molybdopterin-guanine dinucleotide biosynthesis protein A [Kiloniellaceae bacterium]